MAYAILRNHKTEHNEHHDLESFFYVFIYVCVLFNGPNGSLEKRCRLPKFMKYWMTLPYKEAGTIKIGLIHNPEDGLPAEIADSFTSYFKNMLGVAEKLRKACAQNAGHDEFIAILRDCLDGLPETDPVPGPLPPDNYKRYGTFDGAALCPDLPEKANQNPNTDSVSNSCDEIEDGTDNDNELDLKGPKEYGNLERDKPVHVDERDENPFLDNFAPGNIAGPPSSVPISGGKNMMIGNSIPLASLDEAMSQLSLRRKAQTPAGSIQLEAPTRSTILSDAIRAGEAGSPDKIYKNTRLQNRPLLPKPETRVSHKFL